MSSAEDMFARLTWLEPWQPLTAAARGALEQALQRELATGHALFGRPARAIAKRIDSADVLFALEAPAQLAVVHLAHARKRSPESPHALCFDGVQDFVEGCMLPDHAEYSETDEDA
jgi:hypothetical protein